MKQNFENYFEDNHDERIKWRGKRKKEQENQLKRWPKWWLTRKQQAMITLAMKIEIDHNDDWYGDNNDDTCYDHTDDEAGGR